ncbi:MAG: DUF6768 family protein [Planctomycetota bacterium]|jgi:hypothetical protein
MNEEDIKKIIDCPPEYDESIGDNYRSMIRDFFSKELRWALIGLYVWFFIFLAPIIISVIQFFKTDNTQYQIMYAAIFICCCLSIGFLKIYMLVVLQKHRISREIKRLELRIVELAETVKNK